MRIVTLSCVLALGCGGKKDEPKPEPKADPAAAKADPAPAAAKPAEPAPAPPPKPATDLGTCKLSITGAATKTIEAGGGLSAASTSYWFADGDKQREMLYGKSGEPGVILNCVGDGASLNILAARATKENLPFGPKKYEVGPGKDGLSIMGSVGKGSIMGGKGTIDVKEFDGKHIAATIDLTAKLMSPDGDGEVKITGELDFKCPGLSGCAK